MAKTYRLSIWTEKFRKFDLKKGKMMKNKNLEFSEIIGDMSEFAGSLVGETVVAGKKLLRYVNDLTIVDAILKPSDDKNQTSDSQQQN